MKILVTGCSGFIGHALSDHLLKREHKVIGIDNMNNYYDVSLKSARLNRLQPKKNFQFYKASIEDEIQVRNIFKKHKPCTVINLAAQAGVRYSLQNPRAYIDSNISGFMTILEACRQNDVKHLVYASSSSVYGANCTLPFSVSQNVDHPISLYAASKKANELMAHSYSHLFGLPTTGLRFFTVYGPWGRPDMAMHIFTKKILNNETIEVFNQGKHSRDFTYIDDIVKGIELILDKIPQDNSEVDTSNPNSSVRSAPYCIHNIGSNKPIELLKCIEIIESCLDKKALLNFLPLQPGDIKDTWADISSLQDRVGYRPITFIEEGIRNYVNWFKEFYGY